MSKKSYNPFKMWGSWVGLFLFLLLIIDVSIIERNERFEHYGTLNNCYTNANYFNCKDNPELYFNDFPNSPYAYTDDSYTNLICENLRVDCDKFPESILQKQKFIKIITLPESLLIQKIADKECSNSHNLCIPFISTSLFWIFVLIKGFLLGWGIHSLVRVLRK